jgi:Tfp pilus assembly pilus retraction ATPase PilT
MELESLIESAAGGGASDLHLEAGMPAAVRVRGAL